MFNNIYQEFIYKRSYSRWLDKKNRRENWPETVARYTKFFLDRLDLELPQIKEFSDACMAIRETEVMPSMRALWSAGPALARDHICGYNCAALIIDNIKAFSELMYILMSGTGVGFSVERQFINRLPQVPEKLKLSSEVIQFRDSKRGWAEGFYKFLLELYRGKICGYDLSYIRPYGARLKTTGGRASGPGPLEQLLEITRGIFENAKGRNLNSLECYDICCYIADVVICGGVRRSACISLSNLSDDRMAKAKSGNWFEYDKQRQWTNNSVAYTERPDARKLISEWMKLIESRSGERGIFNREAANIAAANTGRRKTDYEWLCNPCGEVLLRPNALCNLTEGVVRPEDTQKDIERKVRYATILGCVQSTLTEFKFIGKKWKDNCEEERLLGVSLTGLRDHPVLNHVNPTAEKWLEEMEGVAIETAKEWAKILKINVPAAICTVKPSGTVSQLVNSSSGLHVRHAPYYIRRVQVSASDPICQLLIDQGMEASPVIGHSSTVTFSFPIKSPDSAMTRKDVTALDQLEYWKMLKQSWCDHNPSCTITVEEDEWIPVLDWVNKNWDSICGLSFLPKDNTVYVDPPYEEIDETQYNSMLSNMPDIDFTKLSEYETNDQTEGSKEFACVSGGCDI